MPKDTFKGMTIAFVGDFGEDCRPPKLKTWVEAKKGKFASKVDDGVTHVVCSDDAFKDNVAPVQRAKALKKVHLVTYDWFEDCTLEDRRFQPSGKYLCKNHFKEKKQERRARKARERKVLKKEGRAPESATSIALSYFTKHMDELQGPAKPRKPDVEHYTLFDGVYNSRKAPQCAEENGSRGDTCSGNGASVGDGDVDDRMEVDEASSARSISSQQKPPELAAVEPDVQASVPAQITVKELDGQKTSSKSPSSAYLTSAAIAKLKAAIAAKPGKEPPSRSAIRSSADGSAASNPLLRSSSLPQIRPRLQAYDTDPQPDLENHHLYCDCTGFKYNITLIRIDVTKNTNERFVLRLYESHTSPSTYAVHLRFHSGKKKPDPSALEAMGGIAVAPAGCDFSHAFNVFKAVFAEKTGLTWEERLDKQNASKVMPNAGNEKYFKYATPREGEPKGLFPVKMPA